MIREETVFGPIFSRRLGSSLGINLLPEKGKICNFDCIYCECGWNRDGRNDTVLPTAEKVRTDLERMLKKLAAEGTPVDSITFSGDGEPTLNPEFPRIIDDTLRLRDLYYPQAKVSVLSNATRVHLPEVFNALRKVDNPIMKIDAPTNELVAKINMPAPGYDLQRVIEALKRFEGNFVLQTCMLRTENGERRVESGERRVESGERRVESGERRVESGERRVESGELRVESGERRVESGERRVESGERRVESGERRVESGEWRVESGERRTENGKRVSELVFDSSSPEVVGPMMDIVRLLKPREWMVYTIDRATPMQGLVKFSPQEMKSLVQPIIDEGVTKVQIKGAVEDEN